MTRVFVSMDGKIMGRAHASQHLLVSNSAAGKREISHGVRESMPIGDSCRPGQVQQTHDASRQLCTALQVLGRKSGGCQKYTWRISAVVMVRN